MPQFNREDQILLLKAGLEREEEKSYSLFCKWVGFQDFEKDFSHTEYRLLPYLWFRHKSKFKEHPIAERFQGVYKRTLFHNTRMIKNGVEVSKLLTENQVVHGFVKGLVFLLEVYPSLGTRPMNDIDLLINENDLEKVSNLLIQAGFIPKKKLAHVKLLRKNSVGFVSKENVGIDVHIRPTAFPIKGFDPEYFLKDLSVYETQLGLIPLLSIERAIEFTILNGLLETDGHWLLDLFLSDSEFRISKEIQEKLKPQKQLAAIVSYRLNLFGEKSNFGKTGIEVPPAYKDFLKNRMKDTPASFRLANLYWYYAFRDGYFRNPYFNMLYYWVYFRYSLIWILLIRNPAKV